MKYIVRTYSVKIFVADLLWLLGHFLKMLADKLEYGGDKIMGIKKESK